MALRSVGAWMAYRLQSDVAAMKKRDRERSSEEFLASKRR